jgi:hypothetical protein
LRPSQAGEPPGEAGRFDASRKQALIMASDVDGDPIFHARKMRQRLEDIVTHLREDIDKVDEPQFKAMFETSAEVLGGLMTTFAHYEEKTESAWKKSA